MTITAAAIKQEGSVFGGVLLVSGCCIGAGMLGLPLVSALGGLQPTMLLFLLSWMFMTCTGLLLLEVNLWFKKEVNMMSMAEETLGFAGKIISGGLFLFLFYSLMVAYLTGSGQISVDLLHQFTGVNMPAWVGSLLFAMLLGIVLYLGTKTVDHINRGLMLGLIVSYVILVFLGIPHIHQEYFAFKDWEASLFALPAMVISFGFHNLVPSLTTYLNRDAVRLRKVFIIGSIIPLLIYLVWEGLILGLVPIEGESGFRASLSNGDMITQTLRGAIGSSWVVDLTHYFAFFAIVTSFLAVGLSFVDFLRDGLHIKNSANGKIIACVLVIVPPFICGLIYPKIFLSALNYAGAFGAVILFGMLPAIMVWKGRYHKKMGELEIVPGGKILLALVIGISFFIMGVQLYHDLQY